MGYRPMARAQPWEIYRRAAAGQSVSEIAREQGWDRKMVREYLKGLNATGLGAGGPAVSKERFNEIAGTLLVERPARASPVRDRLGEHAEEFRELINRDKEPLKPKTAYLVIVGKYEIEASYETFKRFAREHCSRCLTRWYRADDRRGAQWARTRHSASGAVVLGAVQRRVALHARADGEYPDQALRMKRLRRATWRAAPPPIL